MYVCVLFVASWNFFLTSCEIVNIGLYEYVIMVLHYKTIVEHDVAGA